MEEVYKNELDIMMFRNTEVNFESSFDDHQSISKCSENMFLGNLDDLEM